MTDAELAMETTRRIMPLLEGLGPYVQGRVLADLTSLWIAGHLCLDGPGPTARMREDVLAGFVQLVRDLLPANEKMIEERMRNDATT